MALWVGSRDPCLSQESWWIWLTHFLALGPGVTPGGFERLCLSWLSVISERDHSWDVEGEPPTDVVMMHEHSSYDTDDVGRDDDDHDLDDVQKKGHIVRVMWFLGFKVIETDEDCIVIIY